MFRTGHQQADLITARPSRLCTFVYFRQISYREIRFAINQGLANGTLSLCWSSSSHFPFDSLLTKVLGFPRKNTIIKGVRGREERAVVFHLKFIFSIEQFRGNASDIFVILAFQLPMRARQNKSVILLISASSHSSFLPESV